MEKRFYIIGLFDIDNSDVYCDTPEELQKRLISEGYDDYITDMCFGWAEDAAVGDVFSCYEFAVEAVAV